MIPDTTKTNNKWLERKLKKNKNWPIKRFLEGLRIPYKELDNNTLDYNITVPLFGLRFRFGGAERISDDGWHVVFIDRNKLKKIPEYFREDVMWYLVDRGYFSYIRDVNVGIYNTLLIDQRWAAKIMDKRIEYYRGKPQYTFRLIKTEELRKMPLPRVLSLFPGFFDFLY